MINTNELKEFLGCDDQFLAHLMETFIPESEGSITRLKSATESKNWPIVKATAHKMLSSTRIFNLVELSTILQDVEKIADKGIDLESIPARVSTAEQLWKSVVEEMKELLPKLKA